MSNKRGHCPPTGNTPGKPKEKNRRNIEGRHISSKKSLFAQNTKEKKQDWNEDELKGLVRYVALYEGDCWLTHKHVAFWDDCAKDVAECSGMPLRTGGACRLKVIDHLKKKFKTVNDAEEAYDIDYVNEMEKARSNSAMFEHELRGDLMTLIVQNLGKMSSIQRMQLAAFIYSFIAENDFCEGLKHFIPTNFIELSLLAMDHLKQNNKDNVVFNLCKSLGVMREDGSSARLNVNRMPFGLLDFNCKFFASDDGSNLRASNDYKTWMETMYANFGNSWARLHLGPMWSYVDQLHENENIEMENKQNVEKSKGKNQEIDKKGNKNETPKNNIIDEALSCALGRLSIPDLLTIDSETNQNHQQVLDDSSALSPESSIHLSTFWSSFSESDKEELAGAKTSPKEIETMHNIQSRPKKNQKKDRKTMDAKVNVAGPSDRTIRRDIANSGFFCGTEIQVEALKKAKESNPTGRWFIKADATDMKEGLRESVKGKWTGDCDLSDGSLQQAQEQYDKRVKWINGLALKTRMKYETVMNDLKELLRQLREDRSFLLDGMKTSKKDYDAKQKQNTLAEQTMFAT